MNERIKELVEQVGLKSEIMIDESNRDVECYVTQFDGSVPSARNWERFAELIVKGCVKSTLSLHNTAIDNHWGLDETFHMIVDTIVEDLDMKHIFLEQTTLKERG